MLHGDVKWALPETLRSHHLERQLPTVNHSSSLNLHDAADMMCAGGD